MTTNTIKHLQRDGTWFKFDCLYVNKDDNNSDTFVFIVTNKLDLGDGKPQQSIMEIVGNWELYELKGLMRHFDRPQMFLEEGQTIKSVQDCENSPVPDADMSVTLGKTPDHWTVDVTFDSDGSQGSFAASYGGKGDLAYKDTKKGKPFFHVELRRMEDAYHILHFLRDPLKTNKVGEFELEGNNFSIMNNYKQLLARFGQDTANKHVGTAIIRFLERRTNTKLI